MTRWRLGDQVVLREMWQGKVWSGKPQIVVEDSSDLWALFIPAGALWVKPTTPEGGVLRLPKQDWGLGEARWPIDALRLVTPGASHSVLALWSAGLTEFVRWYVNLEEPLRRTSNGFDYMDRALDIVISPDLSEWRWKDEDEFQGAQDLGLISSERARELRAEGEAVIERMCRGEPPFNQGWEDWRPDPAWPLPELPAGWDFVDESRADT